jgi:hypothetical protein
VINLTYICYLLAIDFNHLVRSEACLSDHLESQGRKNSWLSLLLLASEVVLGVATVVSKVAVEIVTSIIGVEESSVVVSELSNSG